MSEIRILLAYNDSEPYDEGGTPPVFGTRYGYTEYVFETDTLAVTQLPGFYDDVSNLSPPVNVVVTGEFHFLCDNGTRRSFVSNGAGDFTVVNELNSVSCNYSVVTCDLLNAAIAQVPTPGGATVTGSVSGARGRVRYRLDGGSEQMSATFFDVAPGPHTLLLRDDGVTNCTRVVRFTVATPLPPAPPAGVPAGIDFVRQPLFYALGAPIGAAVLLQVWAESRHGQEDFRLIVELRKQSDRGGRLNFRLDTILEPLLRAWSPSRTSGDAPQVCREQLVNYFVRTAVLVAGQPVVWRTGPVRTALRGGLPSEVRHINYFDALVEGYGDYVPFLTWQPYGGSPRTLGPKPITPQQPEWLFWLCPPNTPAQLEIIVEAVAPDDVATVVATRPLVLTGRGAAGQLLVIPVPTTNRPPVGHQMQVTVTSGQQPLSRTAKFRIVAATDQSRYLLFTNSVGGLDTLRTEGRLAAQLEAAAERTERPAQFGDASAAPDRQVFDLNAARKLKLATGWLTQAEQAWLQELVLSREVWHFDPVRGPLPLDLAKRSLTYYQDDAALRGAVLEFDYAFAPAAYARF